MKPGHSRAVFRLSGGRVEAFDVASAPLPAGFRFAPGPVLTETAEAVPVFAEIATRVAPWATVWLGPALWRVSDQNKAEVAAANAGFSGTRTDRHGTQWREWGGWCSDGETVFVALTSGPGRTLQTLHHELFHLIDEAGLTADERDALDEAAGGYPVRDTYADRPVERRARMYEHFAALFDGGFPPFAAQHPAASVLWRIYTGEIGAQIDAARREAAKPKPPPKERAGLLAWVRATVTA